MSKVIKSIVFDPEFHPVSIPSVISRRFVDATEQAAAIVREAREEAKRLKTELEKKQAQAEKQAEAEKKRAFEIGLEEGKKKLTQKIIEAATAREKILKVAEPEMMKMVLDIAEKVIGKELAKGAVNSVVKKALSQAAGKKAVVRVNPADAAKLKEQEAAILRAIEGMESVSWKEDAEVPAGGCVVETEFGTVDARLETQMEAIRKALGL